MVAMFEIAFLIVCAGLGLWWFRRTSLYRYRAHRGSSADPREKGGADIHDMTRRPGKFDASSSGFRLRPPPVRRYDDQ